MITFLHQVITSPLDVRFVTTNLPFLTNHFLHKSVSPVSRIFVTDLMRTYFYKNLMVNLNSAVSDILNMVVHPTEVTWKWLQYPNNFIAVFALFPLRSKMVYNLSANNPVAARWNQSSIYQDVIWKKCYIFLY